MTSPKPTPEQYSLFRDYLDARHPDGGMADMSVLDFSMMVEDSHIDTVVTEYRRRGPDTAIHGRGEGPLDRRLPDRPARRRPIAGLFLLRSSNGQAFARRLRHPRPYRQGAAAWAAACLSRLLGRWLAQDGLQRAPIARRSGSASTAGPGSSGTPTVTARQFRFATDWLDAHLGDADLQR